MNLSHLVRKYGSGNIIPILGCELFKVQVSNTEAVNIHEYIIRSAFQSSIDWPKPPEFLSELQFSDPDFQQTDIQSLLKQINQKQKKLDLLNKLAQLKNFKLFIMASFYKEFEHEFRLVNPNESIDIHKSPRDAIRFDNDKRKIFYLFDNIDNTRFAMNDEELLESIFRFATPSINNSISSLPGELQGKTLLFIGCDFSDWFMRYCIRVLCNEPLNRSSNVYIINDNPPKLNYQEFFFKKHNIRIVQSFPVDKFVNEFYEQAIKQEKQDDLFKGSQIFISYRKSSDTQIAQSLSIHLKNNGINTWMDEDDKIIGEHVDQIKKEIFNPKTKLMVSVISKDLMESLDEPKNYIRDVEWNTAITRVEANKWNNKEDRFDIIPYYVGDPTSYMDGYDRLPEQINRQFRFGENLGGFEQLCNKIKNHLS